MSDIVQKLWGFCHTLRHYGVDYGDYIEQLRPNSPTSTEVYCFVCRSTSTVERRPCAAFYMVKVEAVRIGESPAAPLFTVILLVKAGRGGKTVTVVKNFVDIGLPEKEQLAKAMQRACGTGGTVKGGQIEIQGDKREEVARTLTEANFQPVFAGG